MNLLNVPEMSDGAYWYVLNKIIHPITGHIVPEGPENNLGWSAWYFDEVCLVRTLELIAGSVSVPVSVGEFMSLVGYEHKPFARIGGR